MNPSIEPEAQAEKIENSIVKALKNIPCESNECILLNSLQVVTTNDTWYDSLNRMIEAGISCIPIVETRPDVANETGKILGTIDRFTFMAIASSFFKSAFDEADYERYKQRRSRRNSISSKDQSMSSISESDVQTTVNVAELTADVITKFKTSHMSEILSIMNEMHTLPIEGTTMYDIATKLAFNGWYRVYFVNKDNSGTDEKYEPKNIVGYITQDAFFAWMLDQPFVKTAPALQGKTMLNLIASMRERKNLRHALKPATTSISDMTYEAIYQLKGNIIQSQIDAAAEKKVFGNPKPSEKEIPQIRGIVIIGEDDIVMSPLRRRDIDILAKYGDLSVLAEPLSSFMCHVRKNDLNTVVPSAICTENSLVLSVGWRLAVAKFDQVFVSRDASREWRTIQEVVTDGEIMRYILTV